jgi:hypothetical protein
MDHLRAGVVAWLPLAMLVLNWVVVRYGKSDTGGYRIPRRLRPWVPVALAIVASAVAKFGAGASLADALRTAIVGGLGPTVAHELLVESIRNGKEIPVPGMRPVEAPDLPAPPEGPAT